ncbi:tetratricopeptide repeat protein [Vibrio lentus]|uniref:tetratricopeptide repeat protein n=1 Tax=Vibrio lentus TaxID=136468 RepID=UPI0007EEA6A4|nr:sel1 repeat family protein [Vibrio lentus]OBT18664.1 hypothetical protein A9266_16445 [Vibrio tasmaniensis]PMG21595.1 hypothetical protein BCU96_18355 [Vibrio lentus]PMH13589.1 hypothetical protein BCU76_18025 [Vibrio lentus]PMI39966.1 hypothetical protein BCU45_23535 [Vibrio lentus]PMI63453.1 hypothetical protein BCU40_22340 [Vibrio lentus]
MNNKLVKLACLAFVASSNSYAQNEPFVYTDIKDKRVSSDIEGIITHGYTPDASLYYASTVAEDNDGNVQVQGANYAGDPEFDWLVMDGFYAFCDGPKVQFGISKSYMDFYLKNSDFLFTFKDGSRHYYRVEHGDNVAQYAPAIASDRQFFQPKAAFIDALKKNSAVHVEINTKGQLSRMTNDLDDDFPVSGLAEMLTRVMNHCPETAPKVDMTSLSKSKQLVAKAKALTNTRYYDEAKALLLKASKMGDGEASALLGDHYELYEKGDGRWQLAREAWQLGAKQGNGDAMCAAGVDYVQLKHKDKANGEKGLALLRQAETKGASCAYYNLGYMYLRGMVVEKDRERGIDYLKLIAKESAVALNTLLQVYQGMPKERDVEVYPWVKLMIDKYDFDMNIKSTICNRSPEVCKEEDKR